MLTMAWKVLNDLFLPNTCLNSSSLIFPLLTVLQSFWIPFSFYIMPSTFQPHGFLFAYTLPLDKWPFSSPSSSFCPNVSFSVRLLLNTLLNLKNIPSPTRSSYSSSFQAVFCCMAPPIFLTAVFALFIYFAYCLSSIIECKCYGDKAFDVFYICLEQNKCLTHIC